jgi:hypothetical protein
MSEQEVCSLGIRDCRCYCYPPKEELIAAKAEGHWEVQLNTTLWEKIDFVPNEWQLATYPNKYRFVPAVATPVPTGCCPKPVDTDEEVLNYKIENQRIELNRINIQLHRTLVKMDEANSYINKLQDEVSEAKESTQPTTSTSLIAELEKEFAEFLANLFNRRYIDPLVEDFIRNGGSK